jgi:hypothetical protein
LEKPLKDRRTARNVKVRFPHIVFI